MPYRDSSVLLLIYVLHRMGSLVPSSAHPREILSTELPWKHGGLWCKGKIYFAGIAWVNYFKYMKGCEWPQISMSFTSMPSPPLHEWKLSKFAAAWRVTG